MRACAGGQVGSGLARGRLVRSGALWRADARGPAPRAGRHVQRPVADGGDVRRRRHETAGERHPPVRVSEKGWLAPHAASGRSQRPRLDQATPGIAGALYREVDMLLAVAAVFAVLWLLGFIAFKVTSFAIHILLVVAVVALVAHFVTGGRRAA